MTNNLPDTPLDVIIIGAGLTGLTTAFHLKEAGLSLHLVEQRDRPGGVIESHSEGASSMSRTYDGHHQSCCRPSPLRRLP